MLTKDFRGAVYRNNPPKGLFRVCRKVDDKDAAGNNVVAFEQCGAWADAESAQQNWFARSQDGFPKGESFVLIDNAGSIVRESKSTKTA